MPEVTLRYAGGDEARVHTDPFETVYQGAARAGVPILTDCLEGACATCKARCVQGEYELIDPSFDALSGEEEAAGHVLLCQMEARTDCVVEMPYPLAFARESAPQRWPATLATCERLGDGVVRIVLDTGEPLAFAPGQYARIEVPGTDASRAYSFASQAGQIRHEFYIRLIDDGVMGQYLLGCAAPGDALVLHSPLGGFYLRPGALPVLMLAGGTGLAPMLSMLRAMADAGDPRPITVLHGAREARELFGLDAVARLRAAGLNVTLRCTVEVAPAAPEPESGPDPDATPVVGRVTDLLTAPLATGADVYVCGPPAMVQAIEQVLAGYGVPEPRIFVERFNPE